MDVMFFLVYIDNKQNNNINIENNIDKQIKIYYNTSKNTEEGGCEKMQKINVQILFTEGEYNQLQEEADKLGITVPLYIRGMVLKDDVFGMYYQKLINLVNTLQSGTKFNIKALFGVEWNMDRGIKLNLGKTFYGRVESGIVDNVLCIGKDSSNVMWYEKK